MGNEQLFSILDSPMMSFNFQNSEGEKDGYNWYAYVNNDPINYIDPLGLCSKYTVESGDTLSQIAQSSGVSLEQMMGMNPQITNTDLIYPGQQINLEYAQQGKWDDMTEWGKNYQDPVLPTPTVKQIGVGITVGPFVAVSLEIGFAWDSEGGKSPYVTVGGGTYVGASTKFSGGLSEDEGTVASLDDGYNETTTIAIALAGTYDNKENEWEGISGFGVGGGVMWTKTFNLDSFKGDK